MSRKAPTTTILSLLPRRIHHSRPSTFTRGLATQIDSTYTTPSSSPSSSNPSSSSASSPRAKSRSTGPLGTVRSNWLRPEVQEIFDGPLMELVFNAGTVHRMHHDPGRIQMCTLMNIKSEFQVFGSGLSIVMDELYFLIALIQNDTYTITLPSGSSSSPSFYSRRLSRRLFLLLPIRSPQKRPNQSHPSRPTRSSHHRS